ncbi:hypothetical protein OIU79_010903 [Salix purpurea]|uniref:Uncharacterized protein n=1 Tax=Salix purpurea TaxID=77065 RepID=A0A9Q0TA74_SALPP|nr:hypothetical protein OIU79_010903 [Salix purpurea]
MTGRTCSAQQHLTRYKPNNSFGLLWIQLPFYHYHDLSSFTRISSLLTNQYGIPAIDVLVTSEANRCTHVPANCLRHNFTVLQPSSS